MRYLFLLTVGAGLALPLTACTTAHRSDVPAALSQPVDATVQQQVDAAKLAALLDNGKLKVKGGTVILQLGGSGNTASPADNRKAGSRQGSAATGPASTAGNTSRRSGGGAPWWVYALAAVAGAVGWEWLSHHLRLSTWLPWRARVG